MITNDRSSNMENAVEKVDSSFAESDEIWNDEENGEVEDHTMTMSPIITQDDEISTASALINQEPPTKQGMLTEAHWLLSMTCYEDIVKKTWKRWCDKWITRSIV